LNLKNPSKIYAFFETSFLSIKIENYHLSSLLRERKSPLRALIGGAKMFHKITQSGTKIPWNLIKTI